MDVYKWQKDASVRQALQNLLDYAPILETAIAIQQVPAPTFDEGERATLVETYLADLGLAHVQRDPIGNVYACRPGVSGGPTLLIAAHLDTVFPRETDLTIRYEGRCIYGPGLGDNSLGVAGMLHLARVFQAYNLPNHGDIWFVGDVGEEGLGDLCGMRAAVDQLQSSLNAVIALEGCDFGRIHHRAIGVRRYRIDVEAAGGHSWGDFGNTSAVHVLVQIAARLTRLVPPRDPRTTYNIGVINGGTSVNTIAQNASLLLDMRSVERSALDNLVAQVDEVIAAEAAYHPHARVTVTSVGDRPAGAISRDHRLVQMATQAYQAVGATVSYVQSSTDANIPLSRGIPAVCVGLADGKHAHREDEYILPANLGRGMQALLLLSLAASS